MEWISDCNPGIEFSVPGSRIEKFIIPGSCDGKRLSTCPQILMIRKTFLQTFMSYDYISVIKLLFFCHFSLERFFYSKTTRIGVDMALCLLIANVTSYIILAKFWAKGYQPVFGSLRSKLLFCILLRFNSRYLRQNLWVFA